MPPLQNLCGWVAEDAQGALCLEGTGPELVMRTLQPCPMGPPCSPLALSWSWADWVWRCSSLLTMSDTDLGVAFGLQWGCL